MNNIQNMAIYLFEKLLTDSTRKKTEKINVSLVTVAKSNQEFHLRH